MDRLTLTVVLVVLLPMPALAQRVEIGPLFGVYQPNPTRQEMIEGIDCDEPCPPYVVTRVRWGTGAVIGARVAVQVTGRFGIDATIQRGRVTSHRTGQWGDESWFGRENVAATFVAVQPSVRVLVDGFFQVAMAAGPVVVLVSATTTPGIASRANTRVGVALSGMLRALIAAPFTVEFRVSDYLYVEANRPPLRNAHDLTFGVGLAFALNR